MILRSTLLASAAAAALLACSPEGAARPAPGAPGSDATVPDLAGWSLLLVTIDTLRPDRLGSYGYAGAETPHLDRLAREGVRFEHCYSQVPLTLPSHSTLFTGRNPFSHGVRNNGIHYLEAREETLAEVFHDAGYRTAASVAAYVLLAKFGLDQGFERYDDSLGRADMLRGFATEVDAAAIGRKHSAWLAERTEGRFFHWLHFYDPHLPYEPPGELGRRFAADPYSGEVAHVDRALGEVLAELRAAGLLKRTLVLITSDHGEAFGEHGEHGHSIFGYEQNLRVPLILWAPGRLPAGRVVGERVRLLDLMPTLLDLFGLEVPSGVEGRSFAGLLGGGRGPGGSGPVDVYFESFAGEVEKNWAPVQGVIVGEHKYVSLPEPELYDLEADPAETRNLFAERRGIAIELDTALREALLGAGTDAAPERALSEEDAARLEALGYLSPASQRSRETIDPKRGIAIENALTEVEAALERGDAERARAGLAEVERRHPDVEMPIFHLLRHRIAAARGETQAAVETLERGLERFAEHEQLALELAGYLLRQGKPAEVEALTARLLESQPRFSQLWILRGAAALQAGDPGRALESYERALELEPRSVPLRLRIAEVRLQAGDLGGALELYGDLAEEGALDDRPAELFKAAALHGQAGRGERAEALFARGLALEPRGIHVLTYALLLARNGKLEEAARQMRRALDDHGEELTPEQRRLAETMLAQWGG